MFWIRIGVNNDEIIRIHGVNVFQKNNRANYEIDVFRLDSTQEVHSFGIDNFDRKNGLINLCWRIFWELVFRNKHGEIPRLDLPQNKKGEK